MYKLKLEQLEKIIGKRPEKNKYDLHNLKESNAYKDKSAEWYMIAFEFESARADRWRDKYKELSLHHYASIDIEQIERIDKGETT